MRRRPQLSVPTTAALPHSHRLPSNASEVARILTRLSRLALIEVALQWLHDKNLPFCAPFLENDVDPDDADADSAPYVVATSVEEVREHYEDFQARKGGKGAVFDRIVEGDWRHGISLHQLAMAETRILVDRPNSLRWNAFRLAKSDGSVDGAEVGKNNVPRLSGPVFLTNLQHEVAPVARAHYYMTRLEKLPITLLRVYVHDSPYNSQKALKDAHAPGKAQLDGANTIFLAFPDGSPYVYVSLIANMGSKIGSDLQSLKRVVVDAIPKALSRPQHRYMFQPTALHTNSLNLLLSLRGAGRSNNAAGGWSIFAESTNVDKSFLGAALPLRSTTKRPNVLIDGKENDVPGSMSNTLLGAAAAADDGATKKKRRMLVADGRFGVSAVESDSKGLERLDIRFKEPVSARHQAGQEMDNDPVWTPDIRISFQGTHVFAGIRQLVEQGVIDGEQMPGWMTGEVGVSIGVVQGGRIKTKHSAVDG